MRRNLVYYVYPVRGSIWEWNVAQIRSYLPNFSGKKVFVVAQDKRTEDYSAVFEALDCPNAERIVVSNDRLWDAKWFITGLERVASPSEDECTFYAHAKGVTRGGRPTVLSWAKAMYSVNLSRIDLIDRLLKRYSAVGAFQIPLPDRSSGSTWYYSGTFFWLRHLPLFTRNWRSIAPHTHGVELYPGRHIPLEDAYNLTGDYSHRPYDEIITDETCEAWLQAIAEKG